MKNNFTKFLSVLAMTFALHITTVNAQSVADFENPSLSSTDTFWNGSSQPMGTAFTNGDAIFPNYYDLAWGGYWSSGWAYSNVKDSINGSAGNLYGARPAIGHNGSVQYATGQQNSWIHLDTLAQGKLVTGFYLTNSTYAARVIENGNSFSRKFGDTTGTGYSGAQGSYPDYFLLTVYGYSNGIKVADSVNYYLADFRGPDSLDYIVEDWEWVDLTSLGNVDNLEFVMSSTDVGSFGINTPLFFCIDDFTTSNFPLSTVNFSLKKPLKLYPNPVQNQITLSLEDIEETDLSIIIYDLNGKVVLSKEIKNTQLEYTLDFSKHTAGLYFVQLKSKSAVWSTKIIKQ